MSNISATNFSISGTCAISGTVSLSQPLISGSSLSSQGITTTDLTTTGNVLFNTLPISNILPTTSNQLITKSYADGLNLVQSTAIAVLGSRADANDALNVVQDNRILGCETVNTTQNTNITALQTRATTIEGVNTNQATSITIIDNLNITQNNRLLAVENINTNQSTALTNINVLNTTQNNRITACETVNTNQATSITAVEAVNTTQNTNITALQTRATAIETINTSQDAVNTTQNTNITALQQKTIPIAYTTPVAGALTSLTSSLDILPYVAQTFLKVYNINNQAITCMGQAIFGGLGLITTRLQLTNFGTVMTGMSFGSSLSIVGNNTVNFPASSFQGAVIPKVILTPSNNGVFFVVTKSLTSFTYSASVSGVNVDYLAIQSV